MALTVFAAMLAYVLSWLADIDNAPTIFGLLAVGIAATFAIRICQCVWRHPYLALPCAYAVYVCTKYAYQAITVTLMPAIALWSATLVYPSIQTAHINSPWLLPAMVGFTTAAFPLLMVPLLTNHCRWANHPTTRYSQQYVNKGWLSDPFNEIYEKRFMHKILNEPLGSAKSGKIFRDIKL